MRAIGLAVGLLLLSSTAFADVVLTVQRTGSGVDFPQLSFLADGPEQVAAVTLTAGDPNVVFDYFQASSQTGDMAWTLITPDAANGGSSSPILELSFSDFADGDALAGKVDLDRLVGSATVDWQNTLFNNGDLANAVLAVNWLGGLTSSVTFHDDSDRDPLAPYIVRVMTPDPIVPEPATLSLMASGIALMAMIGWKKRMRGLA